MQLKTLLLLVGLAGLLWKFFFATGAVVLGPGVMASEVPQQENLSSAAPIQLKGYQIFPLADFAIKAKVLGRKDYWADFQAELSPLDLALGWRRMSDQSVVDQIEISQSGRWYFWRVKQFPIPQRELETSSANMHMIPADKTVEHGLKQIDRGDIIELQGYLVRVEGSNGWRWQSSMTRDDTGDGACEVILVKQVNIVTPH